MQVPSQRRSAGIAYLGFPGPSLRRDFCKLQHGTEGAVQITVGWFLILQGASQNQKCFSRNYYLSEDVRGAVTGTSVLVPLRTHISFLCRYYGLSVWFPDVIKHLQSNVLPIQKIEREKISNFSVNFTMANQLHLGAEYENGRSRSFDITYFAVCSEKCISS